MRHRLRQLRDDETGATLIELTVATAMGMIIFMGLTMMVVASMHQTTRITNRVHTTAKARVATQRIVNELESACAARYLTPVRVGSSASKLKFARAYGSAVSPSPVMSEVKLEGDNLVIWEYPVSGGSTPEWEFNEVTPTSKKALIDNVGAVSGSQPIFRYYEVVNGLATTPVVPKGTGSTLTAEQADKIVKVDIAIKVAPPGTPISDPGGAAIVQNSAYLRFSSPTYLPTGVNGPCE